MLLHSKRRAYTPYILLKNIAGKYVLVKCIEVRPKYSNFIFFHRTATKFYTMLYLLNASFTTELVNICDIESM